MLCLGIESESKSKYPNLITMLRYSSVILMPMLSLQSGLYFFYDDNNDYFTIASICSLFFASQGVFKLVTVVFKNDHLLSIINRLNKMFLEMDENEKKSSSEFLQKMSNFCYYIFTMQMTCVWLFNFLPLISMFIAFIRGTEIKMIYPHAFWWPFDPIANYVPLLVCDMYLGHLMMAVQNIFDLYFVLIVADFATHFQRLGERIKKVIDDAEIETAEVTREKLHECLKSHNKLNQLFDEFNGIIEYCLLVQMLSSSIIVCFVGIIIIVSWFFVTSIAVHSLLCFNSRVWTISMRFQHLLQWSQP